MRTNQPCLNEVIAEISRLDKGYGNIHKKDCRQCLNIIKEFFCIDSSEVMEEDEACIALLELIYTYSLPTECVEGMAEIPGAYFTRGVEGIVMKMIRGSGYGIFDNAIYQAKKNIIVALYSLNESLWDKQDRDYLIKSVCREIFMYLRICESRSAASDAELGEIVDMEFMRRVALIADFLCD